MVEILNCSFCGKEFNKYYSEIKNNINNFCSIECKCRFQNGKQSSRKGKIYVIHIPNCKCEYCGREFYRNKSKLNSSKHHYCNYECARKDYKRWDTNNLRVYPKNLVKCNECNKEFHLRKSEYIKNNNHFCSINCKINFYKRIPIKKETRQKHRDNAINRNASNALKIYYLSNPSPRLGKKNSLEQINKMKETYKNKTWTEEEKIRRRLIRSKQIIPIKDTSIEIKIQDFLKKLGIDFFTHQYIKQIEHSYQCDILIPSMNLVIECDGNYWHKYPIGRDIDKIRTSELISKGFKVLRLWESEINVMELNDFKNKLGILGAIK